jgi:hypothetical protein
MIPKIRRAIAFWIYPGAKTVWDSLDEVINDAKDLRIQLEMERRKHEDIDPKNLMRQLMGLVSVDMEAMEDLYHGLTLEETRAFHRWGFELSNNQWWKRIRANLLNQSAAKTLREVMVSEKNSFIGCGTINGIMLFDEVVERLRAAHESDVAPQEGFDNAKLIQD